MAKDLEVAIVFADVVGSTQLYENFGDNKASETVHACLEVMKDATYQYNGTVIKTIGDEVMSTFPTVDDAMGAAVMMQQRIHQQPQGRSYRPFPFALVVISGRWCQERNEFSGPRCTRPIA